jgi:hypothetical protein
MTALLSRNHRREFSAPEPAGTHYCTTLYPLPGKAVQVQVYVHVTLSDAEARRRFVECCAAVQECSSFLQKLRDGETVRFDRTEPAPPGDELAGPRAGEFR